MDKNECAFLIEKGQLYNYMTILIIVSMRHQSRYIDTRLDSCKFIAIQNNSYRSGFFVILNQLLEFNNEIKSYQKISHFRASIVHLVSGL